MAQFHITLLNIVTCFTYSYNNDLNVLLQNRTNSVNETISIASRIKEEGGVYKVKRCKAKIAIMLVEDRLGQTLDFIADLEDS